jgi:hypothetical protein
VLRRKLAEAGAVGHVVNRRGVGYRLVGPRPGGGRPGHAGGGERERAGFLIERLELANALSHLSLLALLRRVTGLRWAAGREGRRPAAPAGHDPDKGEDYDE